MKRKLSRRQMYFLKQKCYGLIMVIIGILSAVLCVDKELAGTIATVTVPLGLVFMFSDEMCIMNDYYFEVEDRKLERRRRHS